MLPSWETTGVLPPIRPDRSGTDLDRSPYMVRLDHVVERFATSPERIAILQGLLNYRQALHQIGLTHGFQWLNGSFMEQIELLESRPPNDIDVVTFFYLPVGMDERTLFNLHSYLFRSVETKARFHVDAYPALLGQPTENRHVREITYWYSMWSHRRRNRMWKGFVQVSLDPNEDDQANNVLDIFRQQGGQP